MTLAVNVYERDGTLIRDISGDCDAVRITANRDYACRRTADLALGFDYLNLLSVMGRRIVVTDDGTTVFDGFYDKPSLQQDANGKYISLPCRDKAKTYLLAGFVDDTTYEDLTASDTQRVHSAVSATSNVAIGDEIQSFAVVSEAKLYATVLGVESEVTPDSISGDILDGDYSVAYSATGLTDLRLHVQIDLRTLEAVTAATITTNGTASDVETSQDGLTWSAYAGGTSFRYLRFDVDKASGPITLGATVTTSAAYSASNVSTDDSASWRPASSDLDRRLTIDLGGAVNCNVAYLRWGISSLDRASQFAYRLERSVDGVTWTEIGEYTANASFLAEHLFDSVSMRYLRVTALTATSGLFALRYVDLRLTTSTTSIDTVIQGIAETEGETLFDLTPTRRYVSAVTFESGSKKWDAMVQLAQSIGFEMYYSASGYLTLRPRDNYDTSGAPVFDDPYRLDPDFPDDEIHNQVIAVHEAADSTLRSVVQDNDAGSPTSIPNVGIRTAPIIQAPLADTQAKLDAFALSELQRMSRQKIAVGFEDAMDNSLDAGSVIKLQDSTTGFDDYFSIEVLNLTYTADEKAMSCEVVPL